MYARTSSKAHAQKYACVGETSMCGICLPCFASSAATPIRDLGVVEILEWLSTLFGGSEVADALFKI